MSDFFNVGDKIIFRLKDEPEQFRFGEIKEIILENGIKRLRVEGLQIEDDLYENDSLIVSDRADIDTSFPGWYLANDIAFVHFVK